MEQIYLTEGRPVKVREVKPEDFSMYLKYPAEYKASSESTAYSKISDVVREVYVKVGSKVTRDQVLVSFSQDNAGLQQARLQVQNAESAFNRMELLYKQNGVSRQDYENARTALDVARESLRSVEDMINIKAPISGTVTQINVQKSSDAMPGTALFTISNQDNYEAFFYVLGDEIKDIKTGQKAFIDTGSEKLSGTVTEVSMTMDSMRRAFGAKASFEGHAQSLTSGMNTDVTVEAYRNKKAIIVNLNEMVHENGSYYVFVCDGNRASKRLVKTGRQEGLKFEVTEGLNEGDCLISDGVQYLSDGDLILKTEE